MILNTLWIVLAFCGTAFCCDGYHDRRDMGMPETSCAQDAYDMVKAMLTEQSKFEGRKFTKFIELHGEITDTCGSLDDLQCINDAYQMERNIGEKMIIVYEKTRRTYFDCYRKTDCHSQVVNAINILEFSSEQQKRLDAIIKCCSDEKCLFSNIKRTTQEYAMLREPIK